jgi:subtilisin family serine protease
MLTLTWRNWLGRASKAITNTGRQPSPACRLPRGKRPRLEPLEDRTLPSVAPFVPGELIVKFRPDAAPDDRAAALALAGAARADLIQTDAMRALGDGGLQLLQGVTDVVGAADALRGLAGVEYAEPNWLYTTGDVSNDTHYLNGTLWGMYSDDSPVAVGPAGTTNQFGSQAEEAWNAGFTGSNTVYVGIIDEGVQFTHPDLSANVWNNPFDPADGVDNDGNGYTDDIHGWDFFTGDNTVYDGTGDDHGTHVTGTIAAEGGNGIGVAGVNWNVTYIPAKFLGPFGGSTLDAIAALDYLTDLKVRHGLNIVATNNSWGGGGFSQALLDAINRAGAANILFIAAAGNNGSNNDSSPFYPASYNAPNIISVASITSGGARSSFSNYGATTVDLGAPGSVVRSTVPTNAYADYSGTSMATPHVTGAAALYASANPGATAAQIKSAILNSATPTASLNGFTVTGGRLNISALMGAAPGLTLSISDVSQAEGNDGTTTFSFTVTLSSPAALAVSVTYATANGTATAGSDYTSVSPIPLTFEIGETSKTVTVTVNGDTDFESNETFFVNLSSPVGATIADAQGVGTIQNDDTPPPQPSLSIIDVSQVEGNNGNTAFVFTVTLSSSATETVTVQFATADDSATSAGGKEKDYTATSGTLIFNPGVTSLTVTVSVKGDRRVEGDETFFVNLSNPSGATIADGQGMGTIVNDDGLGPGRASAGDVPEAPPALLGSATAQPLPFGFNAPAVGDPLSGTSGTSSEPPTAASNLVVNPAARDLGLRVTRAKPRSLAWAGLSWDWAWQEE